MGEYRKRPVVVEAEQFKKASEGIPGVYFDENGNHWVVRHSPWRYFPDFPSQIFSTQRRTSSMTPEEIPAKVAVVDMMNPR